MGNVIPELSGVLLTQSEADSVRCFLPEPVKGIMQKMTTWEGEFESPRLNAAT
jgi:hypothetical protein